MRYMRNGLVMLIGLALCACWSSPAAHTQTPLPASATAVQSTATPVPISPATATTSPAIPSPTAMMAETALTEAPATQANSRPTSEPPTRAPTAEPTPVLLSGIFVKGEVPVSGSYTLDVANNSLTLSDDFKIVPGPDLYVILSGVGDTSLDFHTFSAQVLEAPLLRLGALVNSVGAQTYLIPEGTGLKVYASVVIWCDAFSVEFAAAPLRP